MGQILGALQNIDIDTTNASTYKTLVCLASSSVNTSADTASDATNCGILTSVGDYSMTVDFDAVCEAIPQITQVTYKDLLTAMSTKSLIQVRVQSPNVIGSSIGASYYHQFSAYVNSLTITQATNEFVKFSGSFTSASFIDITP
jgi:hypothetical protein